MPSFSCSGLFLPSLREESPVSSLCRMLQGPPLTQELLELPPEPEPELEPEPEGGELVHCGRKGWGAVRVQRGHRQRPPLLLIQLSLLSPHAPPDPISLPLPLTPPHAHLSLANLRPDLLFLFVSPTFWHMPPRHPLLPRLFLLPPYLRCCCPSLNRNQVGPQPPAGRVRLSVGSEG